jgi:tyrosinase
MKPFVSSPVRLPAGEVGTLFTRIDLVLEGVDHSGISYELRVYLNNAEATAATPRQPDAGYVGSLHVFGHGGCFGEEGHCAIPARTRGGFDLRPPHPLTPTNMWLELTAPLTDAAARAEAVTVTVVPIYVTDPDPEATLSFERVTLNVYR